MEPMQIGKRIEACMLAGGYTIKTFGAALGISSKALKAILQGKTLPKSRLLIKIVLTLHVSADYLLGLDEED